MTNRKFGSDKSSDRSSRGNGKARPAKSSKGKSTSRAGKEDVPFSKFRKDKSAPKQKSTGSSSFKRNDKYASKGESRTGTKSRFKEGDAFKKDYKEGKLERDTSKRFKKDDFKEGKGFKGHDEDKRQFRERKPFRKKESGRSELKGIPKQDGLVRLNKYLADAGISSRREADNLILGGTVKVNGVVVDQLGYKVKPGDVVSYADSVIKNERKVYLLLNKPKDFITTTNDPQERRTVMELVRPACRERIYPVGRLDRNTTGLLLFTNDGDLATKLMHPKFNVRKVYHVTLNKSLKSEDFRQITEGMELEDGPVKVDDIAYVGEGKKEVGIEIHSGRNRIVRRIFEQLGYDVVKLDRVTYAGLTKKDLPRGKYRFLTDREIAFLKMLG
jgi:23S rRNA pseudouridine2605 synthase